MRYCKHCGSLLEDDAQVCSYCSAILEVAGPEPDPQAQSGEAIAPAPKKMLNKKPFFITGGILLGIIILSVAVYFLFFGHYYALHKYESVMNGNFKQIKTLAPEEYWEKVAKSSKLSVNEYLKKRIEYLEKDEDPHAKYMREFYGDDYSVSVKIVDSEEISQKVLSEIKKSLKERYDIDPNRIKSGQKLFLKTVISGTKNTNTIPSAIAAIQIDAQWYLIRYTLPIIDIYPSKGYTVFFLASGSVNDILEGSGFYDYE